MFNILLDPLPTTFEGYEINTDFRIGIQLMNLMYDNDVSDAERSYIAELLLFGDEDDIVREHHENIIGCMKWFISGWFTDRSSGGDKKRYVDYDADQWRIYADFRKIYGIDLSEIEYMHWWEFSGLLWNMPPKESSFMRVIGIRQQDMKVKMDKPVRTYYEESKKLYGIEQVKEGYTPEETRKIDEYDKMIEKLKKKE